MTDPKLPQIILSTIDSTPEPDVSDKQVAITEKSYASSLIRTLIRIPIVILKTTVTGICYGIMTSLGRRAIVAGTLYLAGGSIASTIGVTPVMIAGTMMWLL
jgi:hypothetical protein